MKETTQVAEISISYRPAISDKPVIKTALDAYLILKDFYPEDTIHLQERFVVMFLNKANRVLGVYPMSIGGMTSTVADIRLIFSIALTIAAVGVVISHNHPSGSLKPSNIDIQLTERIKEAGRFMEITLQDHIIVSSDPDKYLSFADEGML